MSASTQATNANDRPEVNLLRNARARATREGLPFNVTLDDIRACLPNDGHCPITREAFVLGQGKAHPYSMSLDRIDPVLGYVQGNIAVISHLANTLKNNCTDPQVFRRIAEYLETALGSPETY